MQITLPFIILALSAATALGQVPTGTTGGADVTVTSSSATVEVTQSSSAPVEITTTSSAATTDATTFSSSSADTVVPVSSSSAAGGNGTTFSAPGGTGTGAGTGAGTGTTNTRDINGAARTRSIPLSVRYNPNPVSGGVSALRAVRAARTHFLSEGDSGTGTGTSSSDTVLQSNGASAERLTGMGMAAGIAGVLMGLM